jgi:uncharacterized membrane protein
MMAQYLTAYGFTAAIFLVIDLIWLSQIAKTFYSERLGDLLLDKPNMGAAAGFYAIYVVGIIIFSVAPALRAGSPTTALAYGALFGFFAYATYDMTNYATLRNWPLEVSLVDTAWGACLTGVSALLGYLLTRLIFQA